MEENANKTRNKTLGKNWRVGKLLRPHSGPQRHWAGSSTWALHYILSVTVLMGNEEGRQVGIPLLMWRAKEGNYCSKKDRVLQWKFRNAIWGRHWERLGTWFCKIMQDKRGWTMQTSLLTDRAPKTAKTIPLFMIFKLFQLWNCSQMEEEENNC